MAKALVIGASGYIGTELVRQLKERGDEVYALDLKRIDDPAIECITGDITDAQGFGKALEGRCFDVIYHTASLPGDTGQPYEMINVNVLGLLNVLEWARANPVKRFVLTGTVSAMEWYPGTKFEPPKYLPVDEEHPCNPKDMYASTKRMQELLAITYYHEFQVPTTVLRLTAVVGPRGQGGGRGWREFAEMLREGNRVAIPYFSPEEVCHFVDLRDVARMHIAVSEHPKAVGEIFSCCGKGFDSGKEFQAIVEKIVPGIKVEFGFPWSAAQGGKLYHSMDKARNLLGFEPKYDMADAVRSIKEWIDAGGLESAESGTKDDDFLSGVEKK